MLRLTAFAFVVNKRQTLGIVHVLRIVQTVVRLMSVSIVSNYERKVVKFEVRSRSIPYRATDHLDLITSLGFALALLSKSSSKNSCVCIQSGFKNPGPRSATE